MSWTERFKLTFNTFKNIALPLYLWYLIFFGVFALLSSVFFLLPVGQMLFNYSDFGDFHLSPTVNHLVKTSGPYINRPFNFPGMDFPVTLIPALIAAFALFAILGLIETSLLHTGTFHIAGKGIYRKALFGDFKFDGAARIIGWYFVIFLAIILAILAGMLLSAVLGGLSESLGFVIVIYFFGFFLFTIFLAPWLTTGGFYILARSDCSFGKALAQSWTFFLKNMGALWGAILAMILVQLGAAVIQKISPSLGGILSFLITPFISLIPAVWVITLMEEKEGFSRFKPEHVSPDDYSTDKNGQLSHDHSYNPYDTLYDNPDDHLYDNPYDNSYNNPKSKALLDSYSEDSGREINRSEDTDHHHSPSNDTKTSYGSGYSSAGYPTANQEQKRNPYYPPDVSGPSSKKDNYGYNMDDSEINFCPTCGTRVRLNSIYCAKCGTKLR